MISTIRAAGKSFQIEHDFPDKEMLESAVVSWVFRTDEHTAESFCNYVNGKIGFTAIPVRHIMYTYKGKVHHAWKDWSFNKVERVLTRMGASYWEIKNDGIAATIVAIREIIENIDIRIIDEIRFL